MKRIANFFRKLGQKVVVKTIVLVQDVKGSDTTEKIGMVVVAVVIVGLLAVAVKAFMPGLFASIGQKAQQALEAIF